MRPAFEADQLPLTLYFRALSRRGCELSAYADDADLWQHPDTQTTVRLPLTAPPVDGFYDVALTHRALHHALGTFTPDLDAPEPLFRRLRLFSGNSRPALEQFSGWFGRAALAVECYALAEDLRIDAAAMRRFPGLAPAFRGVQRQALQDRPDLTLLPPRAAVAEALVRFSLGATSVMAPGELRTPLARAVSVARLLASPAATAESSAEAAIRLYQVLAALPNVGVRRSVRPLAFARLDEDVDDAWFRLGEKEIRLEGDEKFDVRFHPVRYRDVPGPRYAGQQASGMPLQEAILRMTPDDALSADSSDEDTDGLVERSLQAERGGVDVTATDRPDTPPEPLPHDHGPDLDDHHDHAHGHLHAHGRDEFVYPEWDSVAGRYLADWTLVRSRRPRSESKPKPERSHRGALARHGHLLPNLVGQLSRVRPAGRDFVRRSRHGDDLDLDACIEALIDLSTGAEPSDRTFVSVQERRRDVAVAFAIDLSSSTAERLPGTTPVKRILDLQRDAVSLLLEALDQVGDTYGIFGFSSGGRDDVRVCVVKDLDERRTPAMLHRLAGLVPDHTTRMGPPIRHLTARLRRHDAATKILLIISDGRPYDLDYGQQYGDDQVLGYAVGDTARALAEARDAGVRPYLITVDPAGADYLGTMCSPREYHVIADAMGLPEALASLYLVARNAA
ncbi:nitric oxide reductase activation protein NorD [Actinoplanes sp. NPDC051513]|uniref:nitric oxide reductase activation protein NorD n=1 Tax=Actinoplanes sp. NPDC051513 TaxID=3363908 RepID=UPI0037BB1669